MRQTVRDAWCGGLLKENGDWLPEPTTTTAGPAYLRVPVPVFFADTPFLDDPCGRYRFLRFFFCLPNFLGGRLRRFVEGPGGSGTGWAGESRVARSTTGSSSSMI